MASPQREPGPAPSTAEQSPIDTVNARSGSDADILEPTGLQRTAAERRESLGKALLQILVATAIFGGLLFLYLQHVKVQEQVREIGFAAKDKIARHGVHDLTEAEKLLGEALRLDGDHPYVLSAMALAQAQLAADYGKPGHLAAAQKYAALAEGEGAEKQERYGARGLILVAEGKYEEAERVLTDVINRGGVGASIYSALGSSQRGQGKIESARANLRRAAEVEWRTPRHNLWIGRTYFEDGDLINARTFITRALEANPDHLLALLYRSRIDVARGHAIPESKAVIDDVLSRPEGQLAPVTQALAEVALAELALYERRFPDAVAKADAALAIDPNLADAHLAKGLALAGDKQPNAVAEMQKAFDLYSFSPRAYHVSALALLDAGVPEEALQVMNTWGERVAKDSAYHVAYGKLLFQKGDNEAAKAQYEEALKLDGRSAEAFYGIGVIQKAAGEFGPAVDSFNKAVTVRERFPEVYEAMGWIYLEQGHFEDALPQFASALNFYKAMNADRARMDKLREDVGAMLKEKGKKTWVEPWLKESGDLIR